MNEKIKINILYIILKKQKMMYTSIVRVEFFFTKIKMKFSFIIRNFFEEVSNIRYFKRK